MKLAEVPIATLARLFARVTALSEDRIHFEEWTESPRAPYSYHGRIGLHLGTVYWTADAHVDTLLHECGHALLMGPDFVRLDSPDGDAEWGGYDHGEEDVMQVQIALGREFWPVRRLLGWMEEIGYGFLGVTATTWWRRTRKTTRGAAAPLLAALARLRTAEPATTFSARRKG